jgi:hypothetical protein
MKLDPEARLLLCCARTALADEDREELGQLLRLELDWTRVLRLGARHGLRPLLHRHLDQAEGVPKAARVELWAEAETIARRNREMVRELLRILAVLESLGIRAVAYKGPTLALAAYGELGLREFGDLDLLLRREDVLAAKRALCTSGYLPEFPLTPVVEAAFLDSGAQYHLVIRSECGRFLVELHWRTDPDFPVERLDDERWWERTGSMVMNGAAVRVLAPDELLMVLCLHGSKHHWASLGWLVDVAELLRRVPEPDWRALGERSEALGCTRRLGVGLALCESLLGLRLPEAARRIAQGPGIKNLAESLASGLFHVAAPEPSVDQALRMSLALFERTDHRIRHCVRTVFSPSLVEWSAWPLPRSLFFLYPPLRIARLSSKYLRRALHPGRPA